MKNAQYVYFYVDRGNKQESYDGLMMMSSYDGNVACYSLK